MTGSPSSEAVNSGAYLKPRGLQILFIWIWQSGIFVRLSHPPPDAPGRQFVDYHLQPSHASRLLSVYRLQNRDRASMAPLSTLSAKARRTILTAASNQIPRWLPSGVWSSLARRIRSICLTEQRRQLRRSSLPEMVDES